MANKKVFTNLQFEGSSELINPRLHPTGTEPTIAGAGHLYYDSSNDKKYLRLATASDTYVNIPTSTSGTATTPFDLGGYLNFSATGRAPFTVADSTVVAGLNAAQVAGKVPNTAANAGDIPIYGTNGILKVGPPVAAEDATPRSYVDNAVQGLDHKESVKYTTTGNIGLTGLSQGNVDGTHAAGDRILVKDQDKTYENGIYVAASGAWTRADDAQAEFVTNGDFAGGSETGWTSNSDTTTTVTNDQLVLTSSTNNYGTVFWPISLKEGKVYKFSYDVIAATSHGLHRIGTTATDAEATNSDIISNPSGVSAGDTLTAVFTATAAQAANSYLSIGARHDVLTLTIDNVSLKEANEGAFVFVEGGSTKANTSWVLSDIATDAWTQFSGAGQISVTSTIDALNDNNYAVSSTAGPLIKSNDTIDFGYNSIHFDVDTNKNLRLKEGGVKGSRLEDNAVDADKLNDSASFTMGGLTVTAGNAMLALNDTSSGSEFQIFSNADELRMAKTGVSFPNNYLTLNGTGDVSVGRNLTAQGTLGVGGEFVQQTVSPSGTLHVSTARYGSDLLASHNGNAEAWTGSTPTGWTGTQWTPSGNNGNSTVNHTQETSIKHGGSNALRLHTTHFLAEALYAGPTGTFTLTAGKTYKYSAWVRNTATSGVQLNVYSSAGVQLAYTTVTPSVNTWTEITGTYTVNHLASSYGNVALVVKSTTGNGQYLYVDDFTIIEDSFKSGVHADGDDLIVSGHGSTGLSIIGQATQEQSLIFGDGSNNSYSRITSSRDGNWDSNIYFKASDNDSLNTVMSLYGVDKSVKIVEDGKLGVGMAATYALNAKTTTAGSWTAWIENAAVSANPAGLTVRLGHAASTSAILDLRAGTDVRFSVAGNGNAFFNGGNVAIGGTSASDKLQIHAGGIQLDNGYQLSWGDTNNAIFGNALYDYIAIKTNGVDRLKIGTDGTHDHKANSIVNSASIQGLQDGTAYTFDGTDDNIAVDALATALAGTTTSTIRWRGKFNTGGLSSGDRLWTFGDTNANEFIMLRTESGNNKLTGFCRDGATDKWKFSTTSDFSSEITYDLVLVQNGTTPVLYVNGIEEALTFSVTTDKTAWFEECAGLDNFRIGSSLYNSSAESAFLACTVLQLQAFPSALTAPDVRKLYSGENPKKNLNVELAVGGSSFANTSAFTSESGGQLSVVSSKLHVIGADSSDGTYGACFAVSTPTVGARYKLTVVAEASNTWTARVGSSVGGSTLILGTSQSGSGVETDNLFFTPSGTTSYVTVFFYGANHTGDITSISVQEVGTLVDLNSQSASTTKWYNEAIPALYNGTLSGGVTLSQGNTYWNNIRQEGGTVLLSAAKTDDAKIKFLHNSTTAHAGISTWDSSAAPHGTDILLGSNAYVNAAGSWKRFNESEESSFVYCRRAGEVYLGNGSSSANPIARLTIDAAGDTSLSGKLGVGAAASSEQLYVSGSVTATGKMGVGGAAGTPTLTVFGTAEIGATITRANNTGLSIDNTGTNGQEWLIFNGVSGTASTLQFKAGLNDQGADGGDIAMLLDGTNKNVGIGTATLNRSSSTTSTHGSTLTIGNGTADNHRSAIELVGSEVNGNDPIGTIAFWNVGGSGNQIATIAGYRWNADNSGALLFQTKNAGTNATRLTLNPDGTQDHKGNPTVNSSTVQGLQDGACYDFDGAADYIDVGTGVLNSENITISVWVKPEDKDSPTLQGIVTNGSTGSDRRDLTINNNRFEFAQTTSSSSHLITSTTGECREGVWQHLAVTSATDGSDTDVVMYVDGVSVATKTISNDVMTDIADACKIGYLNSDRYFNGQIRDVKLFPSALSDGDVRKLYSGENPKKNLQVELVTNGTFDSDANWTDYIPSSNGTVVISGGRMVLTQGDSSTWIGAHQNGIKLTAGKTYHVKGTYTGGSSNGRFYIGPSAVSGSYFNPGNLSGTDGVSYDWFFTASTTDTNAHITLLDGQGATSVGYWDDVSITEVGTLVDFNSRSASPTKWYNQAIPSLYHGTLEGDVTLSAGSTDHYVGGDLEITGLATVGGALTPSINGTHNLGSSTAYWKNAYLEDTAINGTLYAGGAVTAANKLGVGGAPDGSAALKVVGRGVLSYPQIANDATPFSAAALKLAPSTTVNNKGLTSIAFGTSTTENYGYMISGWRHLTGDGSARLIFSRHHNSATGTNVMVLDENHRVGIGTTLPGALLHVEGITSNRKVAIFESDYNDSNPTDVVIKHKKAAYGGLTGTEMTRLSFEGVDNSANSETLGRISTYLTDQTAGSTGAAMAFSTIRNNTLTEALRITDGGRIVNSQTVSDLHRTAEPSLHFSGTKVPADSYVSLTRKTLYGAVTFTAWVKTTSTDTSVDYYNQVEGNQPDTIVGDAHGGVVHSFGLYNGSVRVTHYDGTFVDKSVRSALSQVNDGKWHQVGYTWDLSDGAIQIYIDGVAVAHDGNDNNLSVGTYNYVPYNTIGAGAGGSGNTTPGDAFDGEIKDVRIHNRVLSSDEVAAAYNGESTPWKYADANLTERLTDGGFETWISSENITNWSEYTEGSSTVAQSTDEYAGTYAASLVIDSSDNSVGIFQSGTVVAGRNYRVTFWAKANSGTPTLGVRTAPNSGNGVASNTGHETHTLTTSYAQYTTEFTAPDGHGNLILFRGTGASKTIFIDSVSLVECGEVAAYTPKSINMGFNRWCDETSNNNHGTITGATPVNKPTNHQGQFVDHKGPLIIDEGDTGANRSLLQLNFDVSTVNKYTQIEFNNTDDTANPSEELAFLRCTGIGDYGSALGFYARPTANNASEEPHQRFHVNGSGSVTATSGTSTNLKQVARVHSEDFTLGSSDTYKEITHNLGTSAIVISVRNNQSGGNSGVFEHVEVATKIGGNNNASNTNKCTLTWAAAPTCKDWTVTVTG